ncbi:DUF2188 domain-containing protein [Gorillibacterium timonense]|nr:hypothetical protein [Gorillibacterium timonense]
MRNKAIDIANVLMEEGDEEGHAISIATAQAKEWGGHHNHQIHKKLNA